MRPNFKSVTKKKGIPPYQKIIGDKMPWKNENEKEN